MKLLLLLLFTTTVVFNSFVYSATINDIQHVIVIYMENWSFDGLFGDFPGANGIANAKLENVVQVDENDVPYKNFPQSQNEIPKDLPNAPFDLTPYIPRTNLTNSIQHIYYNQIRQMNKKNGAYQMNKFVAFGNAVIPSDGLVMTYYPSNSSLIYDYVRNYTLCDNFFHGFFGGSWPNANYLICTCAATWTNTTSPPPEDLINILDPETHYPPAGKERPLTPDHYFVNNLQSVFIHDHTQHDVSRLVPAQYAKTIGDQLNEKSVSWAWFAQGWNEYMAGKPSKDFVYHHQAFAYYQNFQPQSELGKKHLKDMDDLIVLLKSGSGLPHVSFVKPDEWNNGHPTDANLENADLTIKTIVDAVMNSVYWNTSAIIVTYDENGGRWDHVPPPPDAGDRWGPGTRVPTYIISPFAKKNYIDKTYYDTGSIHKFLNLRWGLNPLPGLRSAPNDLTNAFDFSSSNNNDNNNSSDDSKSSKTRSIIIITITCLIGVICVAIYFFVFRRHKPVDNNFNDDEVSTPHVALVDKP